MIYSNNNYTKIVIELIQKANKKFSKNELDIMGLFKLNPDDIKGFNLNNAKTFHQIKRFLLKNCNNSNLKEALNQLKGLDREQIDIITRLGIGKSKLKYYPTDNYLARISVNKFIKYRPANMSPDQAMEEIKNLTPNEICEKLYLCNFDNFQISHEMIYVTGFIVNFFGKNYQPNPHYLQNIDSSSKNKAQFIRILGKSFFPDNILIEERGEEINLKQIAYILSKQPSSRPLIESLNEMKKFHLNELLIKIQFDFSDEEMANHNWSDYNIYVETVDYLQKSKPPTSYIKALENIRGLNEYQIMAVNKGLLRDQLINTDWSDENRCRELLYFFDNKPKNITLEEFFDYVKELNSYQIYAVILGLKKDELINHDWEDKNIALRTIIYLKQSSGKNQSLSEKMDEIRGLNQYQIEAVSFGLTKEQIADHDWSKDKKTAIASIIYLTKYFFSNSYESIAQRMDKIKGLNGSQIESNFDLDINYDNNSSFIESIDFIESINNDQLLYEKIEIFKNLNPYQIRAVRDFGLNQNDMKDHDWHNRKIALKTLSFLGGYSRSRTSSAMDYIKGLNQYQIEAIDCGLNKNDLENHNWNDDLTAQETLKYLKKDNNVFNIHRKMNNIRGVDGKEIAKINLIYDRAIENGHNPSEIYSEILSNNLLFDQVFYQETTFLNTITNNILYFNPILNKFTTDLTEDLAKKIAPHLSSREVDNLAKTSKIAYNEYKALTNSVKTIFVQQLEQNQIESNSRSN